MIGSWESECSIVFRFFDREGTKPDLTGPSINLILNSVLQYIFFNCARIHDVPPSPRASATSVCSLGLKGWMLDMKILFLSSL
jgi:hypothetical protein